MSAFFISLAVFFFYGIFGASSLPALTDARVVEGAKKEGVVTYYTGLNLVAAQAHRRV